MADGIRKKSPILDIKSGKILKNLPNILNEKRLGLEIWLVKT
jgi:hypothetical protein